jgi:hypothetical protein
MDPLALVSRILDWFVGWLRESKLLTGQAFVILLLTALLGILGTILFLHHYGPALVGVSSPYLILNFPVSDIIPPPVEGKLSVLSHRKVVDLDHWAVARDPGQDCKLGITSVVPKCDETHIYESWSVLVKDENVPLRRRGYTSGPSQGYSDLAALTPHHIETTRRGSRPEWWVKPNAKAGKLDVIITKRDILGAFQPTNKENDDYAPKVDPCLGNSTAIFINTPTGRAELIVVLPPELQITNEITLRKQINVWDPVILQTNEKQSEDFGVRNNGHLIYWNLSSHLLELGAKNDATFWVSWQWAKKLETSACENVTS